MKYPSEEDIKALKKQEQGGGCFVEFVSAAIVFLFIAVVIIQVIAIVSVPTGEVGIAVPTTATAIGSATQLILADTPTLKPTATAVPTATATPTIPTTETQAAATVPPTYTPLPTYTAVATYTPEPTDTARPTWTPYPTYTPLPTPTNTAVPVLDIAEALRGYSAARVDMRRLAWLVTGLAGLSLFSLLLNLRPSDTGLKRLQKLIEMYLLASLKPPIEPVRATPAPVRTTPLSEYRRSREAPVQDTGYTGVTASAAPPEKITVSVQPEPDVDEAVMTAICDVWNGMERPSLTKVCHEYFGGKNSDRFAIVRRAVKWGRENGLIAGGTS